MKTEKFSLQNSAKIQPPAINSKHIASFTDEAAENTPKLESQKPVAVRTVSMDTNFNVNSAKAVVRRVAERHADLFQDCEEVACLAQEELSGGNFADNPELQSNLFMLVDGVSEECRKCRLKEQKPFSDVARSIGNAFEQYEKPLKLIKHVISQKMGDAMVKTQSGPVAHEVKWEVKSINRSKLDVEALKVHFTDAAIKTAVNKFVQQNGLAKLRGIEFQPVAKV